MWITAKKIPKLSVHYGYPDDSLKAAAAVCDHFSRSLSNVCTKLLYTWLFLENLFWVLFLDPLQNIFANTVDF